MQILLFFLSYAVGGVITFLWLRTQKQIESVSDALFTFILSGAIGGVFSFAASQANLKHWLIFVAVAGVGALVTYKLFEKRK